MKIGSFASAVLIIAMWSSAALAGSESAVALGRADFESQRQAVLRELGPNGRYAEIEPEARQQVQAALERIRQAMVQAGSVEALSEDDRVAVFNDQELVNTLLTRAAADSRLVCRREVKLGSHRKESRCMTVAERRRAAAEAQEALQQSRRGVMPARN